MYKDYIMKKLVNEVKKNYKMMFILIFMVVIFLPHIRAAIYMGKDSKLAGVVEEIPKPTYTLKSYLKGEYQQNYDNYYAQNFSCRRTIIRSYNQLRYDLFDKGSSIIGKEDYLFSEPYIEEYLGLDEEVTQEYLDNLIENLKVIKQKCKEKNKEMYIIITPSKADYLSEYIPDKYYKMQDKERARCYDILTKEFQNLDIKYFDSYKFLKESQITEPVFYKAGIHWSYVAAANSLSEFVKYINNTSNLDLKEFKVNGSEKASEPYHDEDKDIYNLLNIFKGNIEEEYYEPILNFETTEKPDKKMFMQGGSFSWTILEYMKKDIFRDIDFMFYRNFIKSYDEKGNTKEEKLENNEVSDEKLEELIEDKDIILLEINQEQMRNWNNDLIKILREHLER